MNIFAGNLSFDASERDIRKLFEGFGNVTTVVIAMRKEKKAPKSRGFGFVQMPDEQQALAAIAALNGKEFMGRVLNVNPARPKGQKAMVWSPIAKAKGQKAMVWSPIAKAKAEAQAENKLIEKRQLKPGTYKGGRRTHSYMKRRGLAGMQEEAKPRQRSQDNPMRWRKRKAYAKPWQKPAGDAKPRSKSRERPQKSGRYKR